MIREPKNESGRMKILLVDDNSQLREARALMLSTHGYEVEAVRDTMEACPRWRACRPHLVLLALSETADRTFSFCPDIRDSLPTQRVGFLLAHSQYLCPVLLEGGVILQGEGPEDFLARVQAILSGVDAAPAGMLGKITEQGSKQLTGE